MLSAGEKVEEWRSQREKRWRGLASIENKKDKGGLLVVGGGCSKSVGYETPLDS